MHIVRHQGLTHSGRVSARRLTWGLKQPIPGVGMGAGIHQEASINIHKKEEELYNLKSI